MEYNVKYLRGQGLTVKWGKTRNGAPMIFGYVAHADCWAPVDNNMWERAKKVGIVQAFDEHTALIKWFSVPA